jgi:hypothetical protein
MPLWTFTNCLLVQGLPSENRDSHQSQQQECKPLYIPFPLDKEIDRNDKHSTPAQYMVDANTHVAQRHSRCGLVRRLVL